MSLILVSFEWIKQFFFFLDSHLQSLAISLIAPVVENPSYNKEVMF